MTSEPASKQIRLLSTTLALVAGYLAIRASLQLPKFQHLLLEPDGAERQASLGKLILEHSSLFLVLVIVTSVATLISVWMTFRHQEWLSSLGIGLLFFLGERAVASVLDPVIEIISSMSSQ